MTEPPVPLTALSEDQRAQAHSRFTIIRPALEDGITQAETARTHNIPPSTIQRWVKRYREKGFAGLADAKARSDTGVGLYDWQLCAVLADGAEWCALRRL